MSELIQKKCVPCEGGIPALNNEEIAGFLEQVKGWEYIAGEKRIQKHFSFPNYMAGVEFVNQAAKIAESEAHHPDLYIYYKKVTVQVYTHAIGGLSENDFILAAKIDQL